MTAQPVRQVHRDAWQGSAGPAGSAVNSRLTSNPAADAGPSGGRRSTGRARRRREPVENDQYTAFCVRILRAAGRRVADGDVEALPDLARLQQELDQALAAAVTGLRGFGYSWADIASRLGVTRQAAQQRWGNTITSGSSAGQSAGNQLTDADGQIPGQSDLIADLHDGGGA